MATDPPDDLEELRGGWSRAWSTARMGAKLGVKATRRVLWKRKPSAEPSGADVAAAVESMRALVARMGQLKGLVMKLGQIASYMPGTLPPAAQQVLAELQARSTPMAFSRIAPVIEAELGAPVAQLFDSFDERPFAAASIGQVHRARHAGVELAVKVQYPGIEDAIRNDLSTIGLIARMSTVGSALDGKAVAAELRERILEECDYRHEAAQQAIFARLLAHLPGAHVPAVVAERSSRRVIATHFIAGVPLAETPEALRDRVGQTIFRACFDLLFGSCIYNADPHPGNYLVAPDGGVTFLDFGCTRRFDAAMVVTWKAMARAILDGDRAAFETHFRALGFVGKERGFDWTYQWDAMRHLYRPFLEPGFRFDAEFVRSTFGIFMFDSPNRLKTAMPPEWLFLNRLQWGLFAVLAQLHATGPWRALFEDALLRP
jgi:predicted unusual protein kinase regulating ubiquinone biosynthesis (AarF/ABC1/UbiB family)